MNYKDILKINNEESNNDINIFSFEFIGKEIIPSIYYSALIGVGHFVGYKIMKKIFNS